MNWIMLDMETRSTVDLRSASYRRYAMHHTTDVMCLGIARWDQPARVHTPTSGPVLTRDMPVPQEILDAVANGWEVYAHNVAFDKRIYRHICVERLGWPDIPDHQWRDTQAICLYYTLPKGLDKAGQALGLGIKKDKDAGREMDVTDTGKKRKSGTKGRHVLAQVRQPRKHPKRARDQWVATGRPVEQMPLIWWEDHDRLSRMYEYCRVDVESQCEILRTLGPLPPARLRDWQMDQVINERGVPVDWGALYEADQVIEQSLSAYNQQIQKLTATPAYPKGMVQTVNERVKILDWCELQGWCMASIDKASIENALTCHLPEPVRKILTIRQEAGKSSLGKLETMLDQTDPDLRIRDGLVWHGAATGRWAGRGVQFHNFPRGCLSTEDTERFHEILIGYPEPIEFIREGWPDQSVPDTVSAALRSFIRAEPGKKLLISDFSSVEARTLAWLVRCTKLLTAFEAGKCVYTQFASYATGKPESAIEKKSQDRQLGKVAVLGLGYGMGGTVRNGEPSKFQTTAAGAPYNVTLTPVQAKEIVDLFRKTYPEIQKFWGDIETAFIEAVQTKSVVQCGRISVGCNGKWGWMVLPSGRCIWYVEPQVKRVPNPWREGYTKVEVSTMGITVKNHQWGRQALWGGTLTENIVQAIAADILTEAIRRVDEAGYYPIVSIHDECVAMSDKPMDQFHQLMRARPSWAPDLPVDCETHESVRYGK